MEREYIIVEDGVARQVRETTIRTVSEEQLASSILAETQRIDTGLLPSGTVSLTKLGSITAVTLWRPARKVVFGLAEAMRRELAAVHAIATGTGDLPVAETPPTISLALPPQLFGVKVQGSAVVDIFSWFMLDTPTDLDALVYHAPFPNQNEAGKLCAGKVGGGLSGKPLNKLCDAVVGHFYASIFNTDMTMASPPKDWDNTSLYATLHAWSLVEDAMAVKWVQRDTLKSLLENFR